MVLRSPDNAGPGAHVRDSELVQSSSGLGSSDPAPSKVALQLIGVVQSEFVPVL
jgi:hypothetical protein